MKKKARIPGIDLARSLVIFDMILGNFKLFLGSEGGGFFKALYPFIGKTIPTFVVLAGLGIALMSKSARENKNADSLKDVRKKLFRRALFLFVLGLSYTFLWPADILHFYGIYMLICLLVLSARGSFLLLLSGVFIAVFPILYLSIDYTTGWGIGRLDYADFWTLEGFFRHLFYNGYHPVFPWTALMLFGMWLGRLDLQNPKLIQKGFLVGAVCFALIQSISYLTINDFPQYSAWLDTRLMPPLPLYMLHGMAIATTLIMGSLWVGRKYAQNRLIKALQKTGKLSFTIYITHVIIGMGAIVLWDESMIEHYSMRFSMIYGLLFCISSVLFAEFWLRFMKLGPLEWVMRRITG